jgi:hypothetical protein
MLPFFPLILTEYLLIPVMCGAEFPTHTLSCSWSFVLHLSSVTVTLSGDVVLFIWLAQACWSFFFFFFFSLLFTFAGSHTLLWPDKGKRI